MAAPNAPFKTTADFVKYLKANPGKVSFATNGEGAFLHMATELMSDRVNAAFSSFTAIHPHVQAKRVRLLGIAKETRAPNYPNYPTVAETVPGFSSGGWFGFVAPAKVPKEVITTLNREFNAAMKQPDIRSKLEALGLEVWTESPEYFGKLMVSEYEKYGKVARAIKLVPR